jgi:hypothetical protein
MKKRLTFVLIAPRTGIQHRFSINRLLLYACIVFTLLLVSVGGIGVWKAGESHDLATQKDMLEAQHQHMRSIAKAVKVIEQQEIEIRGLLGLTDAAPPPSSNPDES